MCSSSEDIDIGIGTDVDMFVYMVICNQIVYTFILMFSHAQLRRHANTCVKSCIYIYICIHIHIENVSIVMVILMYISIYMYISVN